MPIPRTRTMGMQDVVLSTRIASATAVETLRMVSPIAGCLERVLFVRGGTHSATESIVVTVDGVALAAFVLVITGAARDVDVLELPSPGTVEIPAGGVIKIVNTGSPTQATPIGIFAIVRRQ